MEWSKKNKDFERSKSKNWKPLPLNLISHSNVYSVIIINLFM